MFTVRPGQTRRNGRADAFAPKRVTQRRRAGGVVSAIEQEGLAGFCFDQLQSTRPFNCFQTDPNHVVVHGDFVSQRYDRRNRQRRV